MTTDISEVLKFDPMQKSNSPVDDILKFDPSPSAPQQLMQDPKDQTQASQAGAESDITWRQALIEGLQNIPSSAWDYGKGIYQTVRHPVQTLEAVRDTAIGGMRELLKNSAKDFPELQKTLQESEPQYGYTEGMFNGFIDSMKGRYGSIDNFKQTVAKDPVGVSADIASVLMPAGKLGAMAEPTNIARSIAALPLKLVPEKVPMNWYQSAVKFGTTLSQKERLAVTRTALQAENQIMPTARGMNKLRGMIDDYNTRVNSLINAKAASGAQISVNDLFKDIGKLKNQFKMNSDQPTVWDAAFKGIEKQWGEMLKINTTRTPNEVQRIKTQIYKDLESFYEKQKATPAKVELRKAVARNARSTLEAIVPEVKSLNQKEGALIDLWDAIESKANRISNRDLIGIGLPVKMGTGSGIGYMFGGAEGAALGSAAGFALGIFDTPQVKAKLALVLYRLKDKGIKVKPSTAALRLGLYEANQVEESAK